MKHNLTLLIITVLSLFAGSCQRWETPSTPESVFILTEPQPVAEPAAGGTRAVTIASTSEWSAVSNDSWIYVTPSSGRKGIQEVVIHFDKNSIGKSRSGSITFSCGNHSETFTLTQSR